MKLLWGKILCAIGLHEWRGRFSFVGCGGFEKEVTACQRPGCGAIEVPAMTDPDREMQGQIHELDTEIARIEREMQTEWCCTLIIPKLRALRQRRASLLLAVALNQPQALVLLQGWPQLPLEIKPMTDPEHPSTPDPLARKDPRRVLPVAPLEQDGAEVIEAKRACRNLRKLAEAAGVDAEQLERLKEI